VACDEKKWPWNSRGVAKQGFDHAGGN